MPITERLPFDSIRLSLASPETIRGWAMGEVKKPETINYRTLKPEKDGLFCEKIFGPLKDFECACGKYKKVKFKGIFCERCGVEITNSRVRRERMGYIDLASPVVHIWYFRGTRSRLAYLLSGVKPSEEVKSKPLERVIYFSANMVTSLDSNHVKADLAKITKEVYAEYEKELLDIAARVQNISTGIIEDVQNKIENMTSQELEGQKEKEGTSSKEPKLSAKTRKAAEKLQVKIEDLTAAISRLNDAPKTAPPEAMCKTLLDEFNNHGEFDKATQEFQEAVLEDIKSFEDALKALQMEHPLTGDDVFEREIELSEIREILQSAKSYLLAFSVFKTLHPGMVIDDENLWDALRFNFEKYFEGGMGAEAIYDRIEDIDFEQRERDLRELLFSEKDESLKKLSELRRSKALKTLKIVAAFNQKDPNGRKINDPTSMVLQVLPVIPPDLRPMVELDGGRFATSDQNDLYRRVINRNNRLRRLIELHAPEIIVNNEKRMLQEAVDALLDNGRRGRPVTGQGGRPLKSLSDTLKGKQGRFRQNLLGKRVDFSGRSVIVSGPSLKLHQCGLPKLMALELFKPFVMKRLVERHLAPNIKSAKRMQERRDPLVWDVLADVIKEHPVLLNRAPTLHRLGIQAFEPILIEGKAIQIHPLVCGAFNADFDGDQMAVHVPLSAAAKAEARVLMLSANNILSPANGRPLVTPTRDMLVGSYYMTYMKDVEEAARLKAFRSPESLERAIDAKDITLHTPIQYRIEGLKREDGSYEPTCPGRVIFNESLPEDFPFVNAVIAKSEMSNIVDNLARSYPKQTVAACLDDLKDLCFNYATRCGLTISIDDIPVPESKKDILEMGERDFEKAEKQFDRGLITAMERDIKEIEIWNEVTNKVRSEMENTLKEDPFNSLWMMVNSGARANITQVRQMAGMRGLMNDSNDDPIPRPIKANLKEGLTVLEYFITTIGARKGLVDVARRTPLSGYFTRRLVDVAQEVVINSEDPLDSSVPPPSITIDEVQLQPNGEISQYLYGRLFGRVLAEDVKLSGAKGETYKKGTIVLEEILYKILLDKSVTEVKVLSPLTDDSEQGIAAASYGVSFATGEMVEPGEAVGVIAAQSLGEASTQFTLRTFHTGGDRTDTAEVTGLERVDQLLDARRPGDSAVLAPFFGKVKVKPVEESDTVLINITSSEDQVESYEVLARSLTVKNDQEVVAGEALTSGLIDPHELLALRGVRETQLHLVKEMQKVYQEQGANIHDKHIELIVRQMTRWMEVEQIGDSDFMPGDRVETRRFRDINRALVRDNKRPAEARPVLLGIKQAPLVGGIGRVPLTSDSWLAPASYEYVIDVLTEAAIGARKDSLRNLKENVATGKLIPAGTGMPQYEENVYAEVPGFEPMEHFSSDDLESLTPNFNLDEESAPKPEAEEVIQESTGS